MRIKNNPTCWILLMALILIALFYVIGSSVYKGKKDRIYVDQPTGFEFKNHKIVDGQETFTVEGELINKQDIEWDNVQLVVSIFAGDAYMTYCRNNFDYLGKRSSRNFRLVCRETAGSNLPENITYTLAVTRAEKH